LTTFLTPLALCSKLLEKALAMPVLCNRLLGKIPVTMPAFEIVVTEPNELTYSVHEEY
jgi:hypothetical protein